ncbi:MAG: HAD family phosphatase [Betaproteobacteria bacterium]|nr:MAG: HAD family phosphatase [Betaproteobacteria bacterium]
MKPLAALPAAVAQDIRGVFCDIDDTLTSEGKLTARAYAALERLRSAGKLVIPITGRPAGWCDHIARMWPVDAVVGENGAFYFYYDTALKKLVQRFLFDAAARAANRERMIVVRDRILREVPGCALASDQLYREADLAIDFCEDVPRLADAEVDRIVALMRAAGMTAKISSIHVNGWFGDYDKLGMTCALMQERYGVDLAREQAEYLFVGDSPNDAPMFKFFSNSVGVANVTDFAARLADAPAYVTRGRSGEGFIEMTDCLLLGPRPASG